MVGVDDVVDGPLGEVGRAVGIFAFAVATRIGGARARPLAKRLVKGYLAAGGALEGAGSGDSDALQDIYAEPVAAVRRRARAS